MRTHVQKWGNSLAVRIPAPILKRLNINVGSAINVDIEGENIVLKKSKLDLQSMLNQITPQNLHHIQLDEDSSKGNEEW